jgi:predicted ATPase/class 3 adenylate cyclase
MSTFAAEAPLPEGTVTFLFTDIEGSTSLLQRLGDEYGSVLTTHREVMRAAFSSHGGREFGTQGDAVFVAFASAADAIAGAIAAQRALGDYGRRRGEPVRVRMGVHTGEPVLIGGDYVGIDVHRVARICGAAHGGQIVVSESTLRSLGTDAQKLDFKDLGSHRLKDLDHAEHIVQIVAPGLPSDFPPLRSARPPTNLPRHLGEIVGRRTELNELKELVRGSQALITVTGPGGIGKTRLAIAVAIECEDDFADGAFIVDLSSAYGEDVVLREIAHTLQFTHEGARPLGEALADHIDAQYMLLVLDNFEQAVGAGPVVAGLIERCPNLKVLITSRVVLSIRGEAEYALAPLGLSDGTTYSDIARSDAARLFVERAKSARPGFALTKENAAAIAEICRLVDGLPLAIELAAARIKLLTPQNMLARLDDRLNLLTGGPRDAPLRHRALRTTIDWSYDLLNEDKRNLFRDLAVFEGGATLDAIQSVICGDMDALDPLTALINHSLVQQREEADGDVRFGMLQTIREYALELLANHSGQKEVREHHARYFVDFAEQHAEDEPALQKEHDNMRVALAWLLDASTADSKTYGVLALRLGRALGRFWYTHGHAIEGSEWLERALQAAEDAPEDVRAHSLRLLGVLMDQRQINARARELFEEALTYFRKIGDRVGEGKCLNGLGLVARNSRDFKAARKILEESIALRREIGDDSGLATSLSNLSIVSLDIGDVDEARELLEEAISIDRRLGDDWGIAASANNLGVAYFEQGDLERARPLVEEALVKFKKIGDSDGVAESLEVLAGFAAHEGQALRAGRLSGAAWGLRASVGIPINDLDRERMDDWLRTARAEIGPEAFEAAREEGAEMTTDQAIDYALGRTLTPSMHAAKMR